MACEVHVVKIDPLSSERKETAFPEEEPYPVPAIELGG